MASGKRKYLAVPPLKMSVVPLVPAAVIWLGQLGMPVRQRFARKVETGGGNRRIQLKIRPRGELLVGVFVLGFFVHYASNMLSVFEGLKHI